MTELIIIIIIIIDKINDNDNSDNVTVSHLYLYSQNFFMTRRDDQLISIYFKCFFFLLRSFLLTASSMYFILEIAHFRLWKLRLLLTLKLYMLYLNIRSN